MYEADIREAPLKSNKYILQEKKSSDGDIPKTQTWHGGLEYKYPAEPGNSYLFPF